MTYIELKRAREVLKLTRKQMATVLETTPDEIKRIETHPSYSSARSAPRRAVRLIEAYLSGYRPGDWPA